MPPGRMRNDRLRTSVFSVALLLACSAALAQTPDLTSFQMDVSARSVTEYEPISYSLNLPNIGTGPATNVVVSNWFDPGCLDDQSFDETQVSAPGADSISYDRPGRTLTVAYSQIDPLQARQITIDGLYPRVPPFPPCCNQALVYASELAVPELSDDFLYGVDQPTCIEVAPWVDFSTSTKDASAVSLVVGEQVTYTLQVVNSGSSFASGVVVTDTLDACLDDSAFDPNTDVSADPGPANASYVPGTRTLTVTLPDMAPGFQQTVTLTGLSAAQTGQCCNQAAIESAQSPPVATTQACIDVTTCRIDASIEPSGTVVVLEGNMLTLDASASTAIGCPGTLSYRWLQDFVEIQPWGSSPVLQVIPTLGTYTYSVEVRCDVDPACIGTADVTVVVSAVDFSSSALDVSPSTPVLAGSPLTYTIHARNTGSASATGVTVEDVLDVCLDDSAFDPNTDVSANPGPASASYVPGTRTLTVTLPDIAPGSEETVTLTGLSAAQTGQCCNQATLLSTEHPGQALTAACIDVVSCLMSVSFDVPGPITVAPFTDVELVFAGTPTGCPGSLTYEIYRDGGLIAVTPASPFLDAGGLAPGVYVYTVKAICDADPTCVGAADLTVIISDVDFSTSSMSVSPSPTVEAGTPVTYTLAVRNTGAASATGVTVDAVLDACLDDSAFDPNTDVSSDPGPASASYVSGTRTLTITLPDIASGSEETVTITGLAASQLGQCCNEATVRSNEHVGQMTPPVCIDVIAGGLPDFSLSTLKIFSWPVATSGQTLVYRLAVKNTGSSDGTNVEARLPLPGSGCVDDSAFDPATDGCQVLVGPGSASLISYDQGLRELLVRLDAVGPGETQIITVQGLVAGVDSGCCSQAVIESSQTASVATDDPRTPAPGDAACVDMSGIASPINLLRNTDYPALTPQQIFRGNTCPTPRSSDTSLDPQGPDCVPQTLDCSPTLTEGAGSDDDDYYLGWLEEIEPNMLYDKTRPLVFYQVEDLAGAGGQIYVAKDASPAGFGFIYQ